MKISAFTVSNSKTAQIGNNRNKLTFTGVSNTSKLIVLLDRMGYAAKDAEFIANDIYKTYSNPQRGYHGIKHIKSMLESFDSFIQENHSDLIIKNADTFRFAILMHDYINGESDEVEKSALKAKEFLHKISDNYDTSYVEDLILATNYSKKQNLNFEQQLMQDIDIEILGKPDAEYKEYSKAIRLQYANYSDEVFKPARIKVLKSFLDKKRIYNTRYYQDKYEYQARKNIRNEIESLMSR